MMPFRGHSVGNVQKLRQTLLAGSQKDREDKGVGYLKALDAEEKRFALSGLSIQK